MSSPKPHSQSEQPLRAPIARGRRYAILVAVAAGIATGGAAIETAGSHAPVGSAHRLSTATALQASHVGATSASFVRRMRTLEAAGYVQIGCGVDGALMFNPRFHRYVTVRV